MGQHGLQGEDSLLGNKRFWVQTPMPVGILEQDAIPLPAGNVLFIKQTYTNTNTVILTKMRRSQRSTL